MENTSKINSITCTVIFDGSALNRDEKIGNSILSIKKLTYHGDIRPFISKNAIRHYLFNTLTRSYDWGKTPILAQGSGDKQTMQLDLSKADIISFEELAVFGYMFTKSGESALTRKSPLGITKAISLSNYNQDMAFYANHDFVNRMREDGKKANPNPVNKEEHSGLFKLTFTLDADMIGKDTWIVDDYSFEKDNGVLNIKIAEPQKFAFGNCTEKLDDEGNFVGFEIIEANKTFQILVNGLNVEVDKNLIQKSKDSLGFKPDYAADRKKNNKDKFETKYSFKIAPDKYEQLDSGNFSFECTFEPSYDDDNKILTLLSGHEKKIKDLICLTYNKELIQNSFLFSEEEFLGCQINAKSLNESKPEKGPFKIDFILSEKKKKDIMGQLLFVIKNGLLAQSSNELNTIKPLFILAGDVKVPMPVFHGDIDVKKENGDLKVIGVKDAINNGWLLGNIYIQCDERLIYVKPNDERIQENWETFIKTVLPEPTQE
ncbi:MAG: type I-B CRISPR-associated protein Cas7/Cst2/DevR [Mariniphaga sp.]|nr:type I-B CRISPR-associated protein Cas7/Cst2/DevR [Mariniphaga sp.]